MVYHIDEKCDCCKEGISLNVIVSKIPEKITEPVTCLNCGTLNELTVEITSFVTLLTAKEGK